MKVQVVKDVWGVEVWPLNVELVYVQPKSFPRYDARKRKIIDMLPETDIGKEPYWTNRRWNWGRNKPILTTKQCAKDYPELLSSMPAGTLDVIDLDIG